MYPGIPAILPCVATGALIITGDDSRPALVNRVLWWRPLVFVGLISYSLYLWHRPLFVLVAYYHIEPLGPASKWPDRWRRMGPTSLMPVRRVRGRTGRTFR